MIVTCKSCNARYLVASDALGTEGRQVRCMKCSHEWFHEPDKEPAIEAILAAVEAEEPEEKIEEDIEDVDEAEEVALEPIPDGVKPIPEDSSLPVIPGKERDTYWNNIVSGAAAALVFFISFGILLMLHGTVAKAWPASAALYNLLGIETEIAGEGLIFDKIVAVKEANNKGETVLHIEGSILNMKTASVPVPVIQVALRLSDGTVTDHLTIEPSEEEIGPNGKLFFKMTHPGVSPEIEEVNLRFTP